MEPLLAIIFLSVGFFDMAITDCKTACLGRSTLPASVSVHLARLEYQDDWSTREILLRYDAPVKFGPFQQIFSVASTDMGDIWLGAGFRYTTQDFLAGPLFMETTFQPGLHLKGDGPDIGGALHFRSGLGFGYEFDNGATLTLAYDHRSNANRVMPNPGLDTISIRYSITLD